MPVGTVHRLHEHLLWIVGRKIVVGFLGAHTKPMHALPLLVVELGARILDRKGRRQRHHLDLVVLESESVGLALLLILVSHVPSEEQPEDAAGQRFWDSLGSRPLVDDGANRLDLGKLVLEQRDEFLQLDHRLLAHRNLLLGPSLAALGRTRQSVRRQNLLEPNNALLDMPQELCGLFELFVRHVPTVHVVRLVDSPNGQLELDDVLVVTVDPADVVRKLFGVRVLAVQLVLVDLFHCQSGSLGRVLVHGFVGLWFVYRFLGHLPSGFGTTSHSLLPIGSPGREIRQDRIVLAYVRTLDVLIQLTVIDRPNAKVAGEDGEAGLIRHRRRVGAAADNGSEVEVEAIDAGPGKHEVRLDELHDLSECAPLLKLG